LFVGFSLYFLQPPAMDPVDRVVGSTAAVMSQALDVKIDEPALDSLASRLASTTSIEPPKWDECGWHYNEDSASNGPLTAQYVLVLDALNFCFWPSSTALEYDTLASVLRDVLKADPTAFDANKLEKLDVSTLKGWFAASGHEMPNIEERVRKLNEVGAVLSKYFDGSCATMISRAKGSAVHLVELVVQHFPGFRDETLYKGRQVFLYKRAQIFVADVWAAYGQKTIADTSAFDSKSVAAFYDMHRLTCFADYRIPQLFRALGVFVYSEPLSRAVDAKDEIMAGHPWEVEIRAGTVVAVQRLREKINTLRGKGGITSVEVDWLLWQEGEAKKDVIAPHHRTLTVFY
jgi:Potential Queuosine, Q, salvage protein family